MIGYQTMKNDILNFLDEKYHNAKCMLNYSNPFELLIAIMLSAQTKDESVNKVTNILFNKYKTIEDYRNANIKDIESILKPIGNQTKKSKYIISIANKLKEYNDTIPNNEEFLLSLDGIGIKTTNLFRAMIFNEKKMPVDTHVKRISLRLGLASENNTLEEIESILESFFPSEFILDTHHKLIYFGRNLCKSINPNCNECKLKKYCNYYKTNKKED